VFLYLATLDTLALLAAFASGFVWGGDPKTLIHFHLGLWSVVLNLGVHCIIFIYFLGTGRWVKEVAIAYDLPDQPWPKLTRELKRRTFPPALAAMLIATMISIPLGVTAATHRGSLIDTLSTLIALLGISLPSFALGPLLVLVFSVNLGLTPVSGAGGLDHLILPSVTLGAAMSAILTRIVRSSVLEELNEDYVRTARAKGLPERTVIYKHVLKNGLIPVVTVLGLQFGVLLAGAIITERVFSWPGVGSLLVDSISERDYKLTQGCILVIAATYVMVNTATDTVQVLGPDQGGLKKTEVRGQKSEVRSRGQRSRSEMRYWLSVE
jgi:ABC-type antimicrobial peptide transport system permease subunit